MLIINLLRPHKNGHLHIFNYLRRVFDVATCSFRWIEVLGTVTSVSEEFDSTVSNLGQNGAGEALEEEAEFTVH